MTTEQTVTFGGVSYQLPAYKLGRIEELEKALTDSAPPDATQPEQTDFLQKRAHRIISLGMIDLWPSFTVDQIPEMTMTLAERNAAVRIILSHAGFQTKAEAASGEAAAGP
jgi:hypothetical protein